MSTGKSSLLINLALWWHQQQSSQHLPTGINIGGWGLIIMERERFFFDDRGYDDSVGGYVLGLVVPVRKGMKIIGVLKCNLNILGSISELISGEKNQLPGKLKLVRSGGMVVFEEGFEPLSTKVHGSIFERLKNKKGGTFIIDDSGEKYIVGCSEIELTNGGEGYGFGGDF